MAFRQLPDASPLLVVESDGDELREGGAGRIEHPESGVASAHQFAGSFHDTLEHDGQVEVVCDRHDRVEQPSKLSRARVRRHTGMLTGTDWRLLWRTRNCAIAAFRSVPRPVEVTSRKTTSAR